MKNSGKPDDAFCTRDLEKSIGQRSVNGAFATLFAQFCCFTIKVGSLAILARLLVPDDFGLVAMSLIVTGFASLFKDAGLSMATVQRKSLNHEQASTLFWINLGLSVVISVLVAASAPVVSRVFDNQELLPITVALSAMFLFSGLAIQHLAYLRRHMRMGMIGLIEVGSQATGFILAVISALQGAGYWSLVIQLLSIEIARAALVWRLCPWKPGWAKRDRDIASMLAFGGNLTGSNFLSYVTSKSDATLIGWMWGAGPLGLYSRAMSLLQLPRTLVLQPINQIAIPALSRLQDDHEAYRAYYRRALLLTLAGTMPMMAFALLAAEPIVLILLGDQWVDSIPIFMALGAAAFCQTLDGATGWVNISAGRADRRLKWRLIATPITVASVAIGVQWGALGAGIGYSVATVLLRWPAICFCLNGMLVGPSDVVGAAWRPFSAVAFAFISTLAVSAQFQNASTITMLVIQFFVFGAIYLIGLIAISGGRKEFERRFLSLNRIRGAFPVFRFRIAGE